MQWVGGPLWSKRCWPCSKGREQCAECHLAPFWQACRCRKSAPSRLPVLQVTHLLLGAEGLLALQKLGVDPSVALDAINGSSGRSLQTEQRLPQDFWTTRKLVAPQPSWPSCAAVQPSRDLRLHWQFVQEVLTRRFGCLAIECTAGGSRLVEVQRPVSKGWGGLGHFCCFVVSVGNAPQPQAMASSFR